ncbi:hypothetical protein LPJ59_002065 [Coemansia sp. RSA 2399]|nr:hypothetical protein LPJ59_002065 [Coemansia sp. RSA 2399]KAJ1905732.1 hypothetical protein LPJ81_001765 [Coemansia sp. IMI 209127]
MADAQTQQTSSRPPTLSLQRQQQQHHLHHKEQQLIGAVHTSNTTSANGTVSKSTAGAEQESAASERKDDKAVPVRKRLSLACTTCRQRKVKCDGGRPACRTCAKFNWPCIYQPSNRKRGPRPRALALMDGPMPYSTRSHWSIPHGYYPPYAVPGRSPMSPPPLPPQLMAPHFGIPHHPDIPQNGAPLRLDPAFQQPGGYNYDSYSSYGDYMANTGAIRIRPPPPPSQYMHSPGVAYPPSSIAARPSSGYRSPPGVGHPYARSYQHAPSGGYEAVAHGMPPQSRFAPHDASGSPAFARPFQNGVSDRNGPSMAQPMPPTHYPTHPPPPLSPTAHVGGYAAGEPWRPSGHPADAQKQEKALTSGIGPDSSMREQPASPTTGQQDGLGGGVPPPANYAVTQHASMDASAGTPSLGSPAPQQHMRVSGQPYIAAASPYAAEMQAPSASAGTHSLAIYAQKKSDTAIHRDNDHSVTMANSAARTIAAATECGDYSASTTSSSNTNSRMVLSSPPQPTGTVQSTSMPGGYSTSLGTPMTVPISSTASFAHPAHNPRHYNHLENNNGYASADKGPAHCSPHELHSYAAHAAGASVSPTALSKPLPFTSNGTSRPQLPPLSEVLGKDYRLVMSPGNNGTSNGDGGGGGGSGVQDVTERLPISSSMPMSATGADRFSHPISRRRDSFMD